MADLKLIALDAEDLAVHLGAPAGCRDQGRRHRLSAAREAVCRRRQPLRLGRRARRTARPRRATTCAGSAALRFERVLGAQCRASISKNKSAVLSLLAIGFEPAEAPEPGGTSPCIRRRGARSGCTSSASRPSCGTWGRSGSAEVQAASIPTTIRRKTLDT